jgi:glycosyltransferase involved in cell wall biosynthesis
MKRKICVVCATTLTIHFFLKPHLRGLSEFSDVVLAVNPDNDPYTPELDLPVRVVPIDIRRRISPFHDIKAFFQLISLFLREKPDLVWAVAPKGGLLGMLAARLVGVKRRVFIFQGEVWSSRKGLSRWILKCADLLLGRCATDLYAVGFFEKNFLETEKVVPAGKLKVFGHGSICGVDLDRYKPDNETRAAVRAELGIPPDVVVALFVGRLTEDKGVMDLAAAFREAAEAEPDLWLIIVGPDEEGLKPAIIKRLGDAADRCRILGFTEEVERYMVAADYICLPSYREGFSITIIEAAGAGIPAIGSRIPGVMDTIQDGGTGILVEAGNTSELRDAISRLTKDAELRRHLGRAARLNVEANFSGPEVVRKYIEMFRSGLH